MHTFIDGRWPGFHIHHNPDLSGDVIINVPNSAKENVFSGIEIPGYLLAEFIASIVRDEKISQMEQADINEVFGLAPETIPTNGVF